MLHLNNQYIGQCRTWTCNRIKKCDIISCAIIVGEFAMCDIVIKPLQTIMEEHHRINTSFGYRI